MQENPIPLEPLKSLTLLDFFVQCGAVCFALLTVLFVLLLFSSWKFPMHIRGIGKLSLIVSIVFSLIAFYQMCRNFTAYGFMSFAFWAGLRFIVVPLIYGLVIFATSLVLDIFFCGKSFKTTRK